MDIEQVAFKDLIDLKELKVLFEKFSTATGFTTGLIDQATNEVLLSTGWRDICVEFHRACPESKKHCKASNKELTSGLNHAGEIYISHCGNGLIDGCTPIIIQGKHFANLFTGQVLFAPPDKEIFRKQAQKYSYDEQAYMKSLSKVPVVSEERFFAMLQYLAHTASMISRTGLTNLKSRKESIGKEALLQSIFRSAPVGIGLVVNRVFQWTNKRMAEITGYTSAELKGQTARMLYPSEEEFERVGREKYTQIKEFGTGSVDTRFKRKDGSIVDVHLSSTPIDQQDWAAGVTFTALDITARTEAIAAIQENEQRL
jgi:PAS domain S-box-containing protein